ncbi:MAG: rhodanese-like domain-containing protein, partial [Anaerolineae bacterium]
TPNRTWKWSILILSAVLVGVLLVGGYAATTALADDPKPGPGYSCPGWGWGMMGPGMMGGWDEDCPLYDGSTEGPWGRPYREVNPLSLDEATEAVETFLADLDDNLTLGEIMEFSNHFYAQAVEKDTGIGAYELIIDKYTGAVSPEMGPNMMWNTKYGHMGGWGGMMGPGMMEGWDRRATPDEMTVSEEEAIEYARRFLESTRSGLTPDEHADPFYGYYTLHVLKEGEVVGMLSVNGYNGRVWYHTWHGDFVGMKDTEHEGTEHGHEVEASLELGSPVQTDAGIYYDILVSELQTILQNQDVFLLNVHIPYEGELPGTDAFIPYTEIEANADKLPADKDAEIVVYCRSGSMSAIAAKTLVEMGYTNILNLERGMRAWESEGYPLRDNS